MSNHKLNESIHDLVPHVQIETAALSLSRLERKKRKKRKKRKRRERRTASLPPSAREESG